jgi:hypothetical protein
MKFNDFLANPGDIQFVIVLDVFVAMSCFLVYVVILKRLKIFQDQPSIKDSFHQLLFFHSDSHYSQLLPTCGHTVFFIFFLCKEYTLFLVFEEYDSIFGIGNYVWIDYFVTTSSHW